MVIMGGEAGDSFANASPFHSMCGIDMDLIGAVRDVCFLLVLLLFLTSLTNSFTFCLSMACCCFLSAAASRRLMAIFLAALGPSPLALAFPFGIVVAAADVDVSGLLSETLWLWSWQTHRTHLVKWTLGDRLGTVQLIRLLGSSEDLVAGNGWHWMTRIADGFVPGGRLSQGAP